MVELVDSETGLRVPLDTSLSPEEVAEKLPALGELLAMLSQPGPAMDLETVIQVARQVKALAEQGLVQIVVRDNQVVACPGIQE